MITLRKWNDLKVNFLLDNELICVSRETGVSGGLFIWTRVQTDGPIANRIYYSINVSLTIRILELIHQRQETELASIAEFDIDVRKHLDEMLGTGFLSVGDRATLSKCKIVFRLNKNSESKFIKRLLDAWLQAWPTGRDLYFSTYTDDIEAALDTSRDLQLAAQSSCQERSVILKLYSSINNDSDSTKLFKSMDSGKLQLMWCCSTRSIANYLAGHNHHLFEIENAGFLPVALIREDWKNLISPTGRKEFVELLYSFQELNPSRKIELSYSIPALGEKKSMWVEWEHVIRCLLTECWDIGIDPSRVKPFESILSSIMIGPSNHQDREVNLALGISSGTGSINKCDLSEDGRRPSLPSLIDFIRNVEEHKCYSHCQACLLKNICPTLTIGSACQNVYSSRSGEEDHIFESKCRLNQWMIELIAGDLLSMAEESVEQAPPLVVDIADNHLLKYRRADQ